MEKCGTQRGSNMMIAIVVIAVVLVAIAVYVTLRNVNTAPGIVPVATSTSESMKVKIMVPKDMELYKKGIIEYVQMGGPNTASSTVFVTKDIEVSRSTDTVRAAAEAAASYIPTQIGTSSPAIAYLKIVNGTAYVMLHIQLDGWAGVSVSIAEVEPLVQKTLLQFLEIKSVKFEPAPGDTIEQIVKDYESANQIKNPNVDAQSTSTPVISSITPSSATVGATIKIKGKNLAGFEGDLNAWIVNSSGQKGIIFGSKPQSTATNIQFTLAEKYCTVDTSYSGLPCPSYLNVTPGTYSLYVTPWGKKSNEVKFTVK